MPSLIRSTYYFEGGPLCLLLIKLFSYKWLTKLALSLYIWHCHRRLLCRWWWWTNCLVVKKNTKASPASNIGPYVVYSLRLVKLRPWKYVEPNNVRSKFVSLSFVETNFSHIFGWYFSLSPRYDIFGKYPPAKKRLKWYVSRKKGGRGLTSIKECVDELIQEFEE